MKILNEEEFAETKRVGSALYRLHQAWVAMERQAEVGAKEIGELAGAFPKPSLADFTAAVEQHLLPLLPGRLNVVTDQTRLRDSGELVFYCWVLEELKGEVREVWSFFTPSDLEFDEDQAAGIASVVANKLMERQARG